MIQKSEMTKSKQHLISVRLPQLLYEQLEAKDKELGIKNLSETMRYLLIPILETPLPDKSLQYAIMTHTLMQEAIVSLIENGQSLIDRAEAKAEKALERFSNND